MNKLEELIENATSSVQDNTHFVIPSNQYGAFYQYKKHFKEGTDFVISINLSVKFAEFLSINFNWFGDCMWEQKRSSKINLGHPIQETKDIYEYWLNNVYDGK